MLEVDDQDLPHLAFPPEGCEPVKAVLRVEFEVDRGEGVWERPPGTAFVDVPHASLVELGGDLPRFGEADGEVEAQRQLPPKRVEAEAAGTPVCPGRRNVDKLPSGFPELFLQDEGMDVLVVGLALSVGDEGDASARSGHALRRDDGADPAFEDDGPFVRQQAQGRARHVAARAEEFPEAGGGRQRVAWLPVPARYGRADAVGHLARQFAAGRKGEREDSRC